MSETSKPINVQIDTTMMEDAEVRIIESHLDAIARVVEGAMPQGNPEPEPVPEWRAMVDGQARLHQGESNPLGHALLMLSDLTSYAHDDRARTCLARIVAICEAKVGDGWQADPDLVTHDDEVSCNIECLIYALGFTERWRVLGNRSAAWLRDLTEATS